MLHGICRGLWAATHMATRALLLMGLGLLPKAARSAIPSGTPAFGDQCAAITALPSGLCCCAGTGLVAYGAQTQQQSLCEDNDACSGSHNGFCATEMREGGSTYRAAPLWQVATKSFCQYGCQCCVGGAASAGHKLRQLAMPDDSTPSSEVLRKGALGAMDCQAMDLTRCPLCKCCPVPIPRAVEFDTTTALVSTTTTLAMTTAGATPTHFLLGEGLLAALGERAQQVAPNMTAQHIILMLNASAKLGWQPSAALLTALGKRAQSVVPQMSAQNVASILSAYASIGKAPEPDLMTALSKRAEAVAQYMTPTQVANTLDAYADLEAVPPDTLLAVLGQRAELVAPNFSPEDVANVLVAYAKMWISPTRQLFDALGKRTEEVASVMNAHNVSSAIFAYGMLGVLGLGLPDEALLAALGQRAEAAAPEMGAQDIAHVLGSYTLLWEQLEASVMATVQGKVDTTSQHGEGVLNAYTQVWKLSQMKHLGESLLAALGSRAEILAPTMDAANLALILHSYVKVGKRPSENLLTKLSERAELVVGNMTAPILAAVLHAYGRLARFPGESLMTSLVQRAMAVLPFMSATDVANTVTALARLNAVLDTGVLQLLSNRSIEVASEMAASDVPNTLNASAALWRPMPPLPLLVALEHRGEDVAMDMNAQDVAIMFEGLTKLKGSISEKLYDALAERAQQVAANMEARAVGSLLRSFVSLGKQPDPALLAALAKRANEVASDMDPEDLTSVLAGYAKLWRAHAIAELEALKSQPRQSPNASSAAGPQMAFRLELMEQMSRVLVATLCRQATVVAPNLTARQLPLVLGAFADLQEPPPPALLHLLGQRVQAEVGEMNAQDIAITLHAYAIIKMTKGGGQKIIRL